MDVEFLVDVGDLDDMVAKGKIFYPWPPCRPDHQHPPETPRPSLNAFFSKDKDATNSSSDEDYMNLSSP